MLLCQNEQCSKLLCFDCGTSSENPMVICQNEECRKMLCHDCFWDKDQGRFCNDCHSCFCSSCSVLQCDLDHCEAKLVSFFHCFECDSAQIDEFTDMYVFEAECGECGNK